VNADKALADKWLALAKKVGDDTFEKKFLAFDTLPQGVTTSPSLLQRSLFAENVFASTQKTLDFLKDLQTAYNNTNQAWPGLMLGEFQKPRIADVIDSAEKLHAAHGITLLLKGSPFVLYGDELELHGNNDHMKWSSQENCGFSSNATLKISDCANSVQDLDSHGAGQNLFSLYKRLNKLRKEPSLAWGDVQIKLTDAENVVSFVREAEGFDRFLVAANVNTDKKPASNDFESLYGIPRNGTVAFFYSGSQASLSEFKVGLEVFTGRILLKPGELLVVKFDKRV